MVLKGSNAAHHPVTRKDRAVPFPILDQLGIGFVDQLAQQRHLLPAPTLEFCNALIDLFCDIHRSFLLANFAQSYHPTYYFLSMAAMRALTILFTRLAGTGFWGWKRMVPLSTSNASRSFMNS